MENLSENEEIDDINGMDSDEAINSNEKITSLEQIFANRDKFSHSVFPQNIAQHLANYDLNGDLDDGGLNFHERTGESLQDLALLSDQIDRESDENDVEKKKPLREPSLLCPVARTFSKKVQHNYTDSMMQEALDIVQSQNVSIMQAAKEFGIPRSTLRRYALMVWSAARKKTKGKHETALTNGEEAFLVTIITKMSQAGKYVSTMDVKSTVQYLLDKSNRVVFKDRNRPNAGWVQRFRRRHKDLEIKGSGYTIKRHGALIAQDVADWQKEISNYLAEEWNIDAQKFFVEENGSRIYNLDEMSIAMNYKQDLFTENITSLRGYEEVYTEVTLMAAVSAAGELTQPLIMQKGEGGGHEDDIMPLDQNSYGISFSISGKMNADIFLRWLEAFDKELTEKGVEKPIVILLDDVFAHFHISVFNFSISNGIILLCLPCQPSCLMHPIKVEFFDKVKEAYRIFSREHYQTSFQPVSIDQFPITFLRAWEAVRDEDNISETLSMSFLSYGLVPLNPCAPGLPELYELAEQAHRELLAFKADLKLKPFKLYNSKEPKAKKTLVTKKRKISLEDPDLLPTVKIKKLDSPINTEVPKSEEFERTEMSSPVSVNRSYLPPEIPDDKYGVLHSVVSADRLSGRLDGMQKCIELMESFVPQDTLPTWQRRDEGVKINSEIPFCMWKAVFSLCNDTSAEISRRARVSSKTIQNCRN